MRWLGGGARLLVDFVVVIVRNADANTGRMSASAVGGTDMGSLRSPRVVRIAVGLIALGGAVAVMFGRTDLAVVAILVLLAGISTLLDATYRRLGRLQAGQSGVLTKLRNARRDQATKRSVRALARQVAREAETSLLLLREIERRHFGSFEAERLRAADRHREMQGIMTAVLEDFFREHQSELVEALARARAQVPMDEGS